MEKADEKSKVGLYSSVVLLIILIVVAGYSLHLIYEASDQMASRYGSGISNNWADAMNWLKTTTPECTVVASYWDPGYWIAALSERKTVFDGGSQGAIKHTKLEDLNGLDCLADRGGYIKEEDGIEYCITSRIQDMSGILYTSDEIKAAKVLETYAGNCTEIYELAYNRLIGISQWWSYFSNWDPEKGKGTANPYSVIRLQDQKNLLFENGTTLIYGPFYLKIVFENGTQNIEPLLLQQGRYHKIGNLVLVQNNTPVKMNYPNATVPGTLWIEQGFQTAIYMPQELENSMFTRMFFYDGAGLEYFEPAYINPEVKLFKFNIEKFRKDLKEGTLGVGDDSLNLTETVIPNGTVE
ncbi:MAG: hypothetical protein KAU95_04155 [Candidatus Aenigmarchaeota archaeon]|nr:hypothetical protein [Candidatus Aenigmarchaeota archaeon]